MNIKTMLMQGRTIVRTWAIIATVLMCGGCTHSGTPTITIKLPAPSTPIPVSPLPFAGGSAQLTFAAGGDIYLLDAGSDIPRAIIASATHEDAPAWSPDGMFLAYTATVEDDAASGSAHSSDEEILIAAADRPDAPVNVTHNSRRDLAPAWSPDGQHLAFASDRDGNWGIYVGDVQQTGPDGIAVVNPMRRTFNSAYSFDVHPAWSPDGSRIAYTSDRGLRWQIYTMDKLGGLQQSVTNTEQLRSSAYPAWSPDGTRIAFAATADGNWELYIVSTDGTDLQRLTYNPASDWSPAWSPDSAWIAFVSDRSGNSDLYLIRVDGSDTLRLTDTPTTELSPTWRP